VFVEEVLDDWEFACGNDLEEVVFGDKVKVNEFDEKFWGHDGEVLYRVYFEVVVEPFFGVLLDGCDSVGSEELFALEVNFLWSVKLFEVIFHLIEQNQRLHGFIQPLNLSKGFQQIPLHPQDINEPLTNSELMKVVRRQWEVGLEVLGVGLCLSVDLDVVGQEQLGFLWDCFEAINESLQSQYFGLHEIECFEWGAFVSVDEQFLPKWN
jgi:hypothetical protein